MKWNWQTLIKAALCLFLAAGLTGSALASCGISDLSSAAAAAVSAAGQSSPSPQVTQTPSGPSSPPAVDPSIVGLWHTFFLAGNTVVQEAFQLWNAGGTEVHNPKVDPRQGNVCLGVWKEVAARTFKLTHRVWSWDTNGDFQGTLHLSESLTLSNDGNSFSGTFTLDVYDPSGNFVVEISGTATGERISVGDP